MIIAVDFDGTIVEHAYPRIGKEIPFAIETLKRLQREEQHQLILWTVREGELLDEAVAYCRKKGLEFYAVNRNSPEDDTEMQGCRKLNADVFIDDCNLGGIPDWGVIYKLMKNPHDMYSSFEEIVGSVYSKRKKNFLIRLGESLERK
ncbi:MAG: hypothetical protein LBD45_00315 [Bacteroidales bacterium]|jgi:hypothetical protein|nr:hypothetical protein [Bacteroidales bacterium]